MVAIVNVFYHSCLVINSMRKAKDMVKIIIAIKVLCKFVANFFVGI